MNEPYKSGAFLGRVWREDVGGPAVVTIRDDRLVDITTPTAPTVRDVMEQDDPVAFLHRQAGEEIGGLEDVLAGRATGLRLLAPVDLQAVKACGVTFARSMLERVIEEKAAGNPDLAAKVRARVGALIGNSLRELKAGSPEADRVKAALIEDGVWSQYLEVGIGRDAEVFTKAPVLAAVGHGSDVGIHPDSRWNNPEPEIVLAVDSHGRIKGATLGNDVNLRDVEGRSALLLGKAKDNNASCAIGPFIRLFDEVFSLDDVRRAELELTVEGEDGFVMKGASLMSEISRDPADLVAQTIGPHHQYPDGLVLFLGTLFAPVEDRDVAGQGFTHHVGDRVTIASRDLGALVNTVRLTTDCAPWTFGIAELMRNLSARGLLGTLA